MSVKTKTSKKKEHIVLPKSLRNLRGGNKKKGKGRHVTTQQEDFFCYLLKKGKGMSASAAARISGLNPSSLTKLLFQERIQNRIREIDSAMFAEMREQLDRKYALEVSFLDENLAELITTKKPHQFRGHEHRIKGIELGYKRLKVGAFDHPPSSVTNNNNFNGNVRGTVAEVYQSKWLREKEEQMRRQLEAQNGNDPAPSA